MGAPAPNLVRETVISATEDGRPAEHCGVMFWSLVQPYPSPRRPLQKWKLKLTSFLVLVK